MFNIVLDGIGPFSFCCLSVFPTPERCVVQPPGSNVQTSAVVSCVPRDVKQDVDCSTPTVGLGFAKILLGSPAHPPPLRHLSVRMSMAAASLD